MVKAQGAPGPGLYGPGVGAPELTRPVKLDDLGSRPHAMELKANEAERAAVARRFDCAVLDGLTAALSGVREGHAVRLTGRFRARGSQVCTATGDPVRFALDEPIALLFLPLPSANAADEEVELSESELDALFHDGRTVDWGEAIAQSFGLALDPYPRSPRAAEALAEAGVVHEDAVQPAGALSGLKPLLEAKGRK